MIGLAFVLLGLAAPPPDPCATAPTPEPPDRATARVYAEVGAAELEAGHAEVAAIAYAHAVALDASLGKASAGLAAACAALREQGTRQRRADAEGAFALGVERFRAGDDPGATAAFDRAAEWPTLAAPVGLYRALVALRADDWPEVRRELDLLRKDPALTEGVATLRRLAARQGRVMLTLGGEAGYDDNAELLPETPPAGTTRTPRADAHTLLAGSLVARPVRGLGLRLEQSVSWRDQLEIDALDLLASTSDASLRLPIARWLRSRAAGGLDYLVLGGQSYLFAPRADLGVEVDLLPSLRGAASYRLRWRDFLAPAFAGFTGNSHEGTLSVAVEPAGWLRAEAAYRLAREGARDALFSATAQGAALDLWLSPAPWLRAGLFAGWRHRAFDGLDPNVGFRRGDDEVTLDLRLEADASDHVTCQLGGALLRNQSNVVDFEFSRLSVLGACSLMVGLW